MSSFDKLKNLNDGELILDRELTLFKLSSYRGNPIVKPEDIGLTWKANGNVYKGAVFNGGVGIYKDSIIMSPRCHTNYIKKSYYDEEIGLKRHYMENYISKVCILESRDGLSFKRKDRIIIEGREKDFKYGIEDIRIINFKKKEYILIGCGKKIPPFKGSGGDRIAIYTTYDFENFSYRGIIDTFDSRNALIFPEYIDGKLYMIFRFHPNIHITLL